MLKGQGHPVAPGGEYPCKATSAGAVGGEARARWNGEPGIWVVSALFPLSRWSRDLVHAALMADSGLQALGGCLGCGDLPQELCGLAISFAPARGVPGAVIPELFSIDLGALAVLQGAPSSFRYVRSLATRKTAGGPCPSRSRTPMYPALVSRTCTQNRIPRESHPPCFPCPWGRTRLEPVSHWDRDSGHRREAPIIVP